MAVQQSAGGALGGSKLADVADLATADASRHGGQLQISEGFYWSCDEPRNAAIVNVGGSLASVGEQVTVAAPGSSFGESCLLQAKAHALTAIAHQRTRLVAISRRDYERLIAERRARLHTERFGFVTAALPQG